MARRPELGRVKTRLASGIGAVGATRFYRQTTQSVFRRLGHDRRWQTWASLSPDRTLGEDALWPASLPRIVQGAGDVGARMQHIMDVMPRGPVVIVGSDIPEIKADHIAAAFRALGRADVVFGPAEDGGYWLVGMRRRPRVADIFEDVRWSSEQALEDTLRNVKRAGLVHERVATLSDVDTAEDFARWQKRR